MQTSERGIDLIREYEGLRKTAYFCPAGKLTIGYGHTGPDVHHGQTITEAQANEILEQDLRRFEADVTSFAGACTQGQFDALVCFAFNVGMTALDGSTLLHKHRVGDHAGAAAEFGRWNHSNGKVLAGLVRRRAAETVLYLSDGA